MYRVILTADAVKFFERSNESLRRRFDRCFAQLNIDPHKHNNIKRLKGEFSDYFRYRIGDWRVVYRIDEQAGIVAVVRIAHRRDVYE
jgi:mRNA interferase RelE/StbE